MDHPHLDERMAERRARRKRNLIGAAVIVVVTVALILLVWRQAGVWGVPGFSFTHEHGSRCTNTFTGFECEMTEEHVSAVADTQFPPNAELVNGVFTDSGQWSMTARFRVPAAESEGMIDGLRERFGDCVQHAPSTLRSEPGMSDFCVMTSANTPSELAQYRSWTIATAQAESGDTFVQLDMEGA